MTIRTAFFALLVAVVAGPAFAQAGGAYALGWSSLDGGGQTAATGGLYQMSGTAGQPDAGALAGGIYALNGGFFSPSTGGTIDVPALDPVPLAFAARPPAPSPFRTTTTVAFDLPGPRHVELALFGIDGRLLRRLIDQELPAGRHRAVWDGRNDRGQLVPSGVYFVRIRAGEFVSNSRVVRLD